MGAPQRSSREAMEGSNGPRTHEPNIRELTADLDGLREVMKAELRALNDLAVERDRRYSERDESRQEEVKNALVAAKEQTAASFSASKEAITEAKKSQDAYNLTHNDLVRKMERQSAETMSRDGVMILFKSIEDKEVALIKNLEDKQMSAVKSIEERFTRMDNDIRFVRETIGRTEGKGIGMNQIWGYIVGGIGLAVFIIDHFVK